MSENKNIEYISIHNLSPHPKNPRKRVGDVSELAESIKKNGVLQNLTVVPGKTEGTYTVIIGHRRLAAAKLAELDFVPCVVAHMTDEEQFHTMLTENMQRIDLTPMEQAQGFQIMFEDWGYDEKKIAETTGFSETTVRHRLNMAKLKEKSVDGYEKRNGYQLSLSDFYALEKVPTIKERNEILDKAFNSQQIQTMAAQAEINARREKASKKVIKLLTKAFPDIEPFPAKENRYNGSWETLKEISLDKDIPEKIPVGKAKKGDKLYYYTGWGSEISVFRKKKKEKKEKSEFEKQVEERDRRKKRLERLCKAMAVRRRDFVLAVLDGKIDYPDDTGRLKDDMWRAIVLIDAFPSMGNMMSYIKNKPHWNIDDNERAAMRKQINEFSVLHQMLVVICNTAKDKTCHNYYGQYDEGKAAALKSVYDILTRWGFVLEDEEKYILNGTHELYTQPEPEAESEDEA